MAGIDIAGRFPNSIMAQAAKAGTSRFRSTESFQTSGSGVVGLNSGIATVSGAGTKTTANLLTACGLTSNFSALSIGIQTSASGVTIAQGFGTAVYKQGSVINASNISPTNNPITLTMAAGDIVSLNYSGI
jgi:hypothetical protein